MAQKPAQNEAERRFLASYDAAAFPHPSLAVDVALLTAQAGELKALLVRRDEHPFKGLWALPGGFVGMEESLDAAAARVLKDKGGIEGVYLEQLYSFGEPARDPRTRVISVAYYALVHPGLLPHSLAPLRVAWKGETGGPVEALDDDGAQLPLAFDHADMLGMVVKRLRGKLDYADIGFELLEKTFTLRALQKVHETILGRPVNKDSFRRRMLQSGRIKATGKQERHVGHRPAGLYRFAKRQFAKQ